MKVLTVFLALAAMPALASAPAFAADGRSLPSGEETPTIIEKIYQSPRGEVQFVVGSEGHSAMLRTASGVLAGLREARGPALCEEWLISGKTHELPQGCDFHFYDEVRGVTLSVRSEEMEETHLFQNLKGAMRQMGRYVAL
jgi:hypothetical protein